ncbi:hypothetical protein BKA64DRAFT_662017 [Cadophora sp. MPI-SDFR-AT-0126]|nr:hypothetical protein BKA64DRAFT_662017 [Leotiomycetes sp. MPI-SDFR-AT-0126]
MLQKSILVLWSEFRWWGGLRGRNVGPSGNGGDWDKRLSDLAEGLDVRLAGLVERLASVKCGAVRLTCIACVGGNGAARKRSEIR